MANRIVISQDNTRAIELIEKFKARKQEVKAILSKGVVPAKQEKK